MGWMMLCNFKYCHQTKALVIARIPEGSMQMILATVKCHLINMRDYADNISHYPNCQHGFKSFLKLNASLLFMLTICNSEDHFC